MDNLPRKIFGLILTQLPIYEPFLLASSPKTLYAFSQTCKPAKECVQQYFDTVFDINKHLGFFLPNPLAFRNMQAKTGAIISGSNAVQFFDRTYYHDADLDVFVNPGHCRAVGLHMIKVQGYRVVEEEEDDTQKTLDIGGSIEHVKAMATTAANHARETRYSHRSIHVVCRLERLTVEGKTQMAQVILTSDCVFHAIMNFHSMSLYPLATFEHRTNRNLIRGNATASTAHHIDDALAKYTNRGFPVGTSNNEEENSILFQFGTDRQVGDKWCWTVRLNMEGVAQRRQLEQEEWDFQYKKGGDIDINKTPQDPIFENKWRVSGDLDQLAMKYCLLRVGVFKYGYTVAAEGQARAIRMFSEDIQSVRKQGVDVGRKWFDDNVATISDDVIIGENKGTSDLVAAVGGEEEEVEENNIGSSQTERPSFPLKVTDYIDGDKLDAAFSRYWKSFEREESVGRAILAAKRSIDGGII
ncbi:hypothetical protein HWV62_38068 [Athelia sp. TMB]|nr:hypothetical protein HWV62_38068 [Athelia sp. TMB]